MRHKHNKHEGNDMKNMTVTMTVGEFEYLKSLLQEEVFQLSGLKAISKVAVLSKELKVAEGIEKKIEEATKVSVA